MRKELNRYPPGRQTYRCPSRPPSLGLTCDTATAGAGDMI